MEELFDLWCDDLLKSGHLLKVLKQDDIPNPIILFKGLDNTRESKKIVYKGTSREKEKTIVHRQELLHSITYKPDRWLMWADKSKDVFFTDMEDPWKECYFIGQKKPDGSYVSAVEIKAPPGYGRGNSSDAGFAVKQKWVWVEAQIYVNRVYLMPTGKTKKSKKLKDPAPYLFASTFTPSRYLWTDKATKLRTISNYISKTLKEFLS